METLQARTYAGDADLQPIADFLNLVEAHEHLDEGTSPDELREEFSSPTFDPARDIRIWEDADGTMLAFAQIWIPAAGEVADGYVWFKVHPEHRDGTTESEIFAWGAERMRDVGRERGVRVQLRAGARSDKADRIKLLEQHGFMANRYFLRMSRDLSEPIAEPKLPGGFTIRALAGTGEAAAWIDMFNLSFIDHWNHHPKTVDERLHWMSESFYRPHLDLIAQAPDGTFAAFTFCGVFPDENRRTGRNEGWVELLGTRRGYRNMGLGRAILLVGLQCLKAEGVDTAVLGVDAESPTGATSLYESVGFKPIMTFVNYVKDVR